MTDIAGALCRIAIDLSHDLHGDLAVRAGRAIDEAFDGRDLRSIAIQYVIENAREFARARTAAAEQRATRARLPHAPDHYIDRWEFLSETERATAREANEHWRGVRLQEEAETAGHVGSAKPGSVSQRNECSQCQRCREAWAIEEEHYRKYVARLAGVQARYEEALKAELFVEWTNELLSSEVAMPDGSRTTWGAATVEQHQLRRDMLSKNAIANAESAARHDLAIGALTTAGAKNLYELMDVVAEAAAA